MKFRWFPSWAVAVAFAIALVNTTACGTKTEYKDSEETLEKLAGLQKNAGAKDDYIKTLEKRIADLESGGGGGSVTVTVEGAGMIIKNIVGKGPNKQAQIAKGDARDRELYEAFLRTSRKSKGRVQKCYQGALKKNSALQARTINLKFTIKYRTDGKVSSSSFSPRLSAGFAACMKQVAASWKLPAMPKPVTFASKLTLTPE